MPERDPRLDMGRAALIAQLDEVRAERDALLAHHPDHGHHDPCLMCGEPCNDLAGNPSLWSLRLGNNGWHHIGCVNAALRDLDDLRANYAEAGAKVSELAIKLNEARTEIARLRELIGERTQPDS